VKRWIAFAVLAAASTVFGCKTTEPVTVDASSTKRVPTQQDTPRVELGLKEVATSTRQWTGIAATDAGRVFVNYPLWAPEQPFAVGELAVDGSVTPFPDNRWNSWESGKDPSAHFVCVQAMVVDDQGTLWILDPANPRFEGVIPGGPKLVEVDLSTNSVTRTYLIDADVARAASYLNDVRVDTAERIAYITDSGDGALVVVDLESGEARRMLDDHSSTSAEDVTLTIEGKPFSRTVHADGIALSSDRKTLFYQALLGRTLYAIDTASLRDTSKTDDELAVLVRTVGEVGGSDGLVYLDGYVYLTSLEHDAIRRIPESGGAVEVVVADPVIAWPDSFALTRDALLVTTAQIHRGSNPPEPYRILSIPRAALLPK